MSSKFPSYVRRCVSCWCFRPVNEFIYRGRQCLQCRDPKKDKGKTKK